MSRRIVVIALASVAIAILESVEFSTRNSLGSIQLEHRAGPVDEQRLVDEQDRLQNGVAKSVLDDTQLDSTGLQSSLSNLPIEKKYWSFGFQDSQSRLFTYAASAVNKKHYLANSFLLGYVPFETNRVWVPLATLSQRKRYLFDHKLYGPHMQDVWQNSEQAYAYSHGDCEDHAVLLADWLIGLGFDAKVVLGEVPSGGHAWVWLNYQGRNYVLEATSKQRINSVHDFILAPRATDYRPTIMFNRDQLWVNTGSPYTTLYQGKHWQLRSQFIPQKK